MIKDSFTAAFNENSLEEDEMALRHTLTTSQEMRLTFQDFKTFMNGNGHTFKGCKMGLQSLLELVD